tara:strand:+ start:561 stop:803 length:243 start_codon:yes stop_codon:yes gene_type:complete
MTKIYDYKYIVFKIEDGPKIITEQLRTYGQEGWLMTDMITINGGEHLVAWLAKETIVESPDPQKSKKNKITTLWTEGDSE